jgi:mycofactocin system glycosyltransferase
VADASLRRLAAGAWVGGSPLRLYRVTSSGDGLLARLRAPGAVVVAETAAEAGLLDRLCAAGAAHPVPDPAVARPVAAQVTLVVPVRDRPEALARLFAALEDLGADDRPTAVVIVDDGSCDPSVPARLAADHGGVVVRLDGRGPGAARNAGAAAATSEVLAFVDSDCRPSPGWLPALLAHLGDDRVAVVAPRVRSASGPGRRARYERSRSPLDLGPRPGRVAPLTRVAYVPAAALVVRADAFCGLGGFDEALRWGEDVDLVWRAVEAGHVVRYEPASSVEHDPRGNWPGWLRQRVDYGASAAPLDRRHPGVVAPAVMSPWSAAAWTAAVAGHPVVGAAVALGSATALARRLGDVPPRRSLRLALAGHLGAGRQLARAGVRTWWPLLAAGAVFSRRARRLAGLAVAVHLATTPGMPAERALAVVDDMAYGAGVWAGVVRERRPGALAPRLSRWP